MAGDVVAWAVVAAFVVWFVAAAAAQIRVPRLQAMRRRDALGLLPRFHLFAPNPTRQDLFLDYRTWHDGVPGQWRRFPIPVGRRLTDGLFMPDRRAKKSLYTAAKELYLVDRASDRPAVVRCFAYRHLLARVRREALEEPGAGAVQFQLVVGAGTATTPVFRSRRHEVRA